MGRKWAEEKGSALVEAAIVIPVLLLLICGSVAMTDALVLKLKLAEALRYALWETTVFKGPTKIETDVRSKFADLRSPSAVRSQATGLVLYSYARNLSFRTQVETTTAEVALGGSAKFAKSGEPWDRFVDALGGALDEAVGPATRAMGFNTHGLALARVAVEANATGRSVIAGELRALSPLRRWHLQAPLPSQRPMQLVFDTWKAWPKPATYTSSGAGTDVSIAPSRTYPEVERQVSAQVGRIAFFGARRIPGFDELRGFASGLLHAGVTRTLAGGTLPDVFSTDRMDGTGRGPITILPPERAAESWVPHRCEIAGADVPCPTQRAGDVTSAGAPRYLDGDSSIGDRVDRARYTVPYRIRTTYWARYGGMDRELESARLDAVDPRIAAENEYVKTYRCRGHFFGGSQKAQTANAFGGCK
ncbi:MAG TPA: TadE/TadG family type IV pilus assembly protein [Myxococcales bacterium]|nr:TadE/TadG family type IV pilus assembly protein [Myxococcales bacterium]